MDYKEYKVSRNLSWEILLREEVKELPVKVSDICASMGIALKSYTSTDSNPGFCNIVDGKAYIFVDQSAERTSRRFTAAHELGHILLGHVGEFMHLNSGQTENQIRYEEAADVFAIRLLAPACVLWGCGIESAQEIARVCDIGIEAAESRLCRMKVLKRRDKFLTSDIEKELFEKFKPFISQYRQASGK
jgi:Predicted Zn peptidase